MILQNKTSYCAVKIFEFSGLNDKISDKTRAVLDEKCFIDQNLKQFLSQNIILLMPNQAYFFCGIQTGNKKPQTVSY